MTGERTRRWVIARRSCGPSVSRFANISSQGSDKPLFTSQSSSRNLVVSGGAQLTDWELKLLWPFSPRGFIYPLVPWGDPGVSVILVAGMFAMWRWRDRLQSVATASVVMTVGYLVARGLLG